MEHARQIIIFIAAVLSLTALPPCAARKVNDVLQNRPYADSRPFHLGFYVGMNMMDLRFTHNGHKGDSGQEWFMAQPGYSPGFNVGGLADFRLNPYFSLRLTPGLYFGSRDIRFRDAADGTTLRQNIKSTLVALPVDVKFAAQRYKNSRPYITAGAMAAFDVAKKRNDYLKLKSTDFYLTFGLGCDFYLPYFQLNPELKFCIGLSDMINRHRPDLDEQPDVAVITESLSKATSRMVVLTFYFE